MFLEESARDAFEKTQAPPINRFSRAEVIEQVNLSDKLGAVSGEATAAGGVTTPGGVVGGVVAAPFVAAGAVVGAAGAVLGIPGGPLTSDDQKSAMLARLKSTSPGPAYDALFVEIQLMGHREAFTIHDGYARNGDDPALRRVARGALPLIRLHLAQLAKLQGTRAGANG